MQELKDKIILSAHKHFLIGGVRWLDLDLVANDCCITRKLLGQCFKRNELIDAVIKSKIETYQRAIAAIETEKLEPIEEMTRILNFTESLGYDLSAVLLWDLRRHYQENYALIDSFITGSLKKIFKENLTKGINRRIYRKAINEEMLTDTYFIAILALIEKDSNNLQSELKNVRILEMNSNFLTGLLAEFKND
ncbi:MAG: hypothetical protein WC716_12345 [Chitinophagaceae bacterium]|jgi:hypothetical protein